MWGTQRFLGKALLALIVFTALGVAAAFAATQPTSRSDCDGKAQEALKNIDKRVADYEREMQSIEPVRRAKYEEWIRELKKLKALVAQAKVKLGDTKACSSDECVADQCSLVGIADQQVTQLIRETEEQIGESARYGEEGGREVLIDNKTLGDSKILPEPDPNDAAPPSYGVQSGASDNPTSGSAGAVFGDDAVNGSSPSLPTTNPREELSPQ